ncbi:hypothetical protein YC2023_081124 [Brassica napus]
MNCLLQHPDHAHKAYKKSVTNTIETVLGTTVDTGKCRSPQGVSETDAYTSTTCYNLRCPGFVQTSLMVLIEGANSPVRRIEPPNFNW